MRDHSRSGMTRRWLAGLSALAAVVAADLSPAQALPAAGTRQNAIESPAPVVEVARRERRAQNPVAAGQYAIEFRARYALSYGHSYVMYGQLNSRGEMVQPKIVGLHPASDSSAVYMWGHLVPVPSETGASDGDGDERYTSARWRIPLTAEQYAKVSASIDRLKASSPVWHAALYNCNAFVGDIARSMGMQTPHHWLAPQDYITSLRRMNAGEIATGSLDRATPANRYTGSN